MLYHFCNTLISDHSESLCLILCFFRRICRHRQTEASCVWKLRPKLVEQYSGSVGYANRVTTSGAQNGTDHVCINLIHFVSIFLMQRLQGLQIQY